MTAGATGACAGWGYADLLPYFRRSETSWRGAGVIMAGRGPLSVLPAALPIRSLLPEDGRDGAGRSAFRLSADFNIARPRASASPTSLSARGGGTARRAPISIRCAGRSNLAIETGRWRRGVLIDARQGGRRRISIRAAKSARLRARREVDPAGGAFNSPQLPMLSGIGPAAHLREHGVDRGRRIFPASARTCRTIRSRSHLGGVGATSFDRKLRLDRSRWASSALAAVRHRLRHRQPAVGAGLHPQRSGRRRGPTSQFQISHTSFLARPWFPGWRKGAGHQFTAGALLLDPESRGRVSAALARPGRSAAASLAQFPRSGARSRQAAHRMIRFARRFFATAPASDLVAGEGRASGQQARKRRGDRRLEPVAGDERRPSTSTCAMGVGDEAWSMPD